MSGSRLIVPALEEEPWPTLGPEVCAWIEACLVHGPGDVLGERVTLTDEERAFIWRAYEVYPRGHEMAGRRRFKRVVYSRRKGCRKTELAAWLAIAEMDPTAPVRCDGWRKGPDGWAPVGRPVTDPYIPMVAVTEEQTDDLAYGAVYSILTQDSCGLVDDYDVGLDRILHKRAPGKIQALASSPSARDGARTSFQHFDETHLFTSPRLRQTHQTMLRNVPKRRMADPWSLETTTMYGPGEGSVAEEAHELALATMRGQVDVSDLYFDHRQASESWNIGKADEREAAVLEASGDAAAWADIATIVSDGAKALRDGSENEWRRYWLNQPRRSSTKWHPVVAVWPARRVDVLPNVIPGHPGWPAEGTEVVLAFDGSYSRDSTALVGATVAAEPYVFVVEVWERPPGQTDWRTPRLEVEEVLSAAMARWRVAELAVDPPGWHREIEEWESRWDVVVRFDTNQPSRMGPACDEFSQAVADGDISHDGSDVVARHLGNCVPVSRRGYQVVTKDKPDSPHKIDAAVAAVVAAHRARWHALNGRPADLLAEIW